MASDDLVNAYNSITPYGDAAALGAQAGASAGAKAAEPERETFGVPFGTVEKKPVVDTRRSLWNPYEQVRRTVQLLPYVKDVAKQGAGYIALGLESDPDKARERLYADTDAITPTEGSLFNPWNWVKAFDEYDRRKYNYKHGETSEGPLHPANTKEAVMEMELPDAGNKLKDYSKVIAQGILASAADTGVDVAADALVLGPAFKAAMKVPGVSKVMNYDLAKLPKDASRIWGKNVGSKISGFKTTPPEAGYTTEYEMPFNPEEPFVEQPKPTNFDARSANKIERDWGNLREAFEEPWEENVPGYFEEVTKQGARQDMLDEALNRAANFWKAKPKTTPPEAGYTDGYYFWGEEAAPEYKVWDKWSPETVRAFYDNINDAGARADAYFNLGKEAAAAASKEWPAGTTEYFLREGGSPTAEKEAVEALARYFEPTPEFIPQGEGGLLKNIRGRGNLEYARLGADRKPIYNVPPPFEDKPFTVDIKVSPENNVMTVQRPPKIEGLSWDTRLGRYKVAHTPVAASTAKKPLSQINLSGDVYNNASIAKLDAEIELASIMEKLPKVKGATADQLAKEASFLEQKIQALDAIMEKELAK